jgi:hypothetical protein
VHGQRGFVSPCSHWDDALNAKPNGDELILDCLRRGGRRDAFDDNPVGLGIVMPDEIKWDFVLF